MMISIYDRTTPLEKLRDEYGWDSSPENLSSLVMVLCSRLADAEVRLKRLEARQPDDEGNPLYSDYQEMKKRALRADAEAARGEGR